MNTQQIAINRALALLNAAKAQYKIITPEGEEFGDLEVAKPVDSSKRQYMMPYYLPYVAKLEPEQIARIPFGDYEPERLRSAVGCWCQGKWGSESYISTLNRAEGFVEILRVQ